MTPKEFKHLRDFEVEFSFCEFSSVLTFRGIMIINQDSLENVQRDGIEIVTEKINNDFNNPSIKEFKIIKITEASESH